jgi:hypothetical protein
LAEIEKETFAQSKALQKRQDAEKKAFEKERKAKLAVFDAELELETTTEARKKVLTIERARVDEELAIAQAAFEEKLAAEKEAADDAATQRKNDAQNIVNAQQWQIEVVSSAVAAAQAILVALSGAPPPFNAVLAAITAGLAAVQTGVILANPPPKLAKGGSFIVPAGFENDSFPITSAFAKSGERVTVTPQGELETVQSTPVVNNYNFTFGHGWDEEQVIKAIEHRMRKLGVIDVNRILKTRTRRV